MLQTLTRRSNDGLRLPAAKLSSTPYTDDRVHPAHYMANILFKIIGQRSECKSHFDYGSSVRAVFAMSVAWRKLRPGTADAVLCMKKYQESRSSVRYGIEGYLFIVARPMPSTVRCQRLRDTKAPETCQGSMPSLFSTSDTGPSKFALNMAKLCSK